MSTSSTKQPDSYWTAADVARFLTVSAKWVYKHAELGTIPSSRFGANLRFDPEEIRAYAKRNSRGAQSTTAKVLPFHPAT